MHIKIDIDLGNGPILRRVRSLLSGRTVRVGAGLALASTPFLVYAAVNKPHTFADGQTIGASQMNENFDTIYTGLNEGLPAGVVMFFDGATCPTGWSELTAARGRAIVGLNPGGTLKGTVDTALTNNQSMLHAHSYSQVPSHSHSVTDPGHRHNIISRNDDFNCSGDGSGYFGVPACRDNGWYRWNADHAMVAEGTTTGISIQSAGVSSPSTANAGAVPYIQLTVCRRD